MRAASISCVLVLVLGACGGQPAPPAPSVTPGPVPAPTPTPPPSPSPPPPTLPVVAVLVSVTVNPSVVTSPQESTGTLTLSDPAPPGGAAVAVSSGSSAARTPESVTISGGSSSATFTITTAQAPQTQDSTIAASYNGVLINTTLRVLGRAFTVAAFTVMSGTRGADACAIKNSGGSFDCVVDGSASRSTTPVRTWYWSNSMFGRTRSHSSTQPQSAPEGSCALVFSADASPLHDSQNDAYLPMTVSLYIEASDRERSEEVTRTVRVYPNRFCGYSF